eukprot:5958685-Prymnesium_polylepis.1
MLYTTLVVLLLLSSSATAYCPSSDLQVYVHYMLWFDYPNVSGHWNWYNASSFNPRTQSCNNTEDLATWYPPLGGAFASYDTTHLARDAALLKGACVTGVIFDYQQPSESDPSRWAIDKAFPAAVRAFEAVGLRWAVMYDTSSKPDWGKGDPSVASDWARL